MKKKLKTLEEHNGRSWAWFSSFNQEPQLNGIACPNCGEELYDTNPNVTLTSDPPQKNIGCIKCDYKGYRIC